MNKNKKMSMNIRRELFVLLFLFAGTLAVYLQVWNYEFCLFDDPLYVYQNSRVLSGITIDNITWAFTSFDYGNWHPMTWLSHMIDVHLYGIHPGRHHMVNVIFHILNTLLLFIIFKNSTNTIWRSGCVALLFAIHPMHVESVAWISERKDVLSTFFWMLTLTSYIYYAKNKTIRGYVWVVVFLLLGLMAKPMIVTLPFVLLLLDYWPLGRFSTETSTSESEDIVRKEIPVRLIYEKIPLFLMIAGSSIITYIAQSSSGAVASIHILPIVDRISNALAAYIHYMYKMIVPSKLAFFYPYPISIPVWMPVCSLLIIFFITFLFFKLSKRYKYLIVGWLWYVGTLVPVIGLVQIGRQAMADRYTYIPFIGLFIIVSWGIPDIIRRTHLKQKLITGIVALTATLLMMTTWMQVQYWSNSIRLFQHATQVIKNNTVAHQYLGLAYASKGDLDNAIDQYRIALAIDPHYYTVHNNLGIALMRKGNIDEAISHYKTSLQIYPQNAEAYNNFGSALVIKGRFDEAINHYQKALALKSDYADAYYNIGIAYYLKGNINAAIVNYQNALRQNPFHAKAHTNLGLVFENKGLVEKAARHYTEALKIDDQLLQANYHYAELLFKKGSFKSSIYYYQKVLKINPEHNAAKQRLKSATEAFSSENPSSSKQKKSIFSK